MSRLTVVGLSHHTAPIEVREKMAGDAESWAKILVELRRDVPEVMALATCNRVEVYAVIDGAAPLDGLADRLLALRGGDASLRKHLYLRDGREALHHLFRVAGSLDSMVVGETQIAGQLKQAFTDAQKLGTTGPLLAATMARAFEVSRRVRSQTAIGESAISVASVAVDLARQIFGDLTGSAVLVVGAGKMGGLAARHLRAAMPKRIYVANRSPERGAELAKELGAQARPLTDLETLLGEVDIVLCSTGAQQPILTVDMVKRAMKKRRGRWLFLIDIALPRDIEPAVSGLENVYLYDVDALSEVAESNRTQRRDEAHRGEDIIKDELARWEREERARGLVPTIRALREHFHAIAKNETARVTGRLGALGDKERQLIEALGAQIVNKLLHTPQTVLKGADEADGLTLSDALARLFQLDPAAAHETASSDAPTAAPTDAPRREKGSS